MRKKKSTKLGSYFLPDVLNQILARLPAKTLLRFRCVCRTWRSLIDDPDFIRMHITLFKHNRERTHLLLIHCNSIGTQHGIVRLCDTFRKVVDFSIPLPLFCVFGYVNGLLLMGSVYNELGLWNPSIEKFVTVPLPTFVYPVRMEPGRFGLGYDSSTDDYKVVAISSGETDEHGFLPVEVFSLKTTLWKRIHHNVHFRTWDNGVYLKGSVNWIGSDGGPVLKEDLRVITYDVSTELFTNTTKVPDANIDPLSLCVFDGCLSVLEEIRGKDFGVWVMEKYCEAESWTKRLIIKYYDGFKLLRLSHEVLFAANGGVKSYDDANKGTKDLAKTYPKHLRFKDTFLESLVMHGTSKTLLKHVKEGSQSGDNESS